VKFLVDAQLPRSLCVVLRNAGHDAIHTSELPEQNRTPDQAINALSVADDRIVISKDTDFYYSHVLYRRPYKLLLIRTGNIRARDLCELIERQMLAIVAALESHSLVELDRSAVHVP
jgi:predicted nuclease of predicted toxin-antitoxin system